MHTVRASGISETSPKHLHHVCFCVSSGVLLGLLPSRPFHSNDDRFVTCVCRCARICLEVDWGSISNEQSFVGIFHHNFPILSTSMNEWKMFMKWWDWAFFFPLSAFSCCYNANKRNKRKEWRTSDLYVLWWSWNFTWKPIIPNFLGVVLASPVLRYRVGSRT